MEPTSPLLLILLIGGCGGLLVAVARPLHWALRAASGLLAMALAIVAGIAMVNDHYGYYQSWSTLASDLSGSSPNFAIAGAPLRHGRTIIDAGSVQTVDLPGSRSGIDRRGLIYLPPQYNDPKYANVRFPVIELFHGSPGVPSDWVYHLKLTNAVDAMIARHLMGPVVIVMPQINDGSHYVDCVNTARTPDETYLALDVPAYVREHYRVSTDPASWGLAGYSSGGYCAANLGLRHRAQFGAVAALDGYYRAQDGPAGAALGNASAALAANSPIAEALALNPTAGPVPAFWVATGTGNSGDYRAARAFVGGLNRIEQVSFIVEPHAGHDFYAWARVLPTAMAWMWQQLASPDLRRSFPIDGSALSVRIQPNVHWPHASSSAAAPPGPSGAAPTAVPSGTTPSSRSRIGAAVPRATMTVTVTVTPRA